jgi:hypothetical protein
MAPSSHALFWHVFHTAQSGYSLERFYCQQFLYQKNDFSHVILLIVVFDQPNNVSVML